MQSAPEPQAESRTGSLLRWLSVLVVLLVGLALGALAGYRYAKQSMDTPAVVITAEQIAAQDAAVRQSQAESRFLRAQLDTADGEIAVERAARQELETQLRAGQEELGRVRDRLAFFEQLLPPGPEGAVDIRGAEVQRDGQGLKYRVLLMRSGRGDAPFVGALRFQASGVLKGDLVTVGLAPMQIKSDTPEGDDSRDGGAGNSQGNDKAAGKDGDQGNDKPAGNGDAKATAKAASQGDAKANDKSTGSASQDNESAAAGAAAADTRLPVRFDQYQRAEGILELPEGFVPESVTISLLDGATVRAARTIKLEF